MEERKVQDWETSEISKYKNITCLYRGINVYFSHFSKLL